MSTVIAAPIDRLLYKPEEAAEALAIGRSTVYELMAEGALKYIKLGRTRSWAAHAGFVARILKRT